MSDIVTVIIGCEGTRWTLITLLLRIMSQGVMLLKMNHLGEFLTTLITRYQQTFLVVGLVI